MRLTPADVHNVAFKKPSIGKRGYDEDEVDAFLDLVEVELSRLIEENNGLTQRLVAYESGGVPVGNGSVAEEPQEQAGPTAQQHTEQAPVDDVHEHQATTESAQQDPAQSQQATYAESTPVEQVADQDHTVEQPVVQADQPAQVSAVATAGSVAGVADHHLQAARLLGLAQETAERLTGEANAEAESTRSSARADAEKLLTDSRNESEKMLTDARNDSERMVSEAKNSSESMVAEATAKAEATVKDSQLKAEAIDTEAQRKYSEVMNQLTTQRTGLEKKIDDLRTYEREYRGRLKSWITDQLQQLDASAGDASATDAESTPAPEWPASADDQSDPSAVTADAETDGE